MTYLFWFIQPLLAGLSVLNEAQEEEQEGQSGPKIAADKERKKEASFFLSSALNFFFIFLFFVSFFLSLRTFFAFLLGGVVRASFGRGYVGPAAAISIV